MNDMTEAQHLDAPPLALSQALRIADIHPSPTNPRKTFPEAEQAELIANVKRHGVMTPILVRPWPEKYHTNDGWLPKYELVAGERRYRAAKAAGLEFISGTVRDLSDHEVLELQIIENLHRKDLNELEEAEGYELMTKQYGYSVEALAEKIDKSKAYIYARLKLTAAGEAAREAFREGKLDASRLLLVARIPTAGLQQQAVSEITGRDYLATYRAAAQYVQSHYMLKLAEAPFPRGDADLVPAAGKCHPCPKRTGSNPELYPDVKSADICTDPECYAAKKSAHFARVKAEAKTTGQPVIEGKAAEKLTQGQYSGDIKGYLKLDNKCYDAKATDGQYPTYRELIANQAIPITLFEKPDGALVEVIPQSAFKAVAAEVGVKRETGSNEDQKKREAAAKEETEVRRRIHAQIRTATQEDIADRGPALEPEELQLVARQYFAQTWHENQKHLARLWIESDEKIADSERISRLSAMIDDMAPEQACLFLIDLALIGTTHCGPWDKTETPAPLLATASRLNVSVDTIRREVKAEKGAKAKGSKKAAKAEAPAAPVEPEQPAPASVAVEAQTETTAPMLKAGDVVVVKADAVAEGGWALSSRGKSGTIVRPDDDNDWYIVKIGDGEEALPQDSLIFIARDLPPAEELAAKDTPARKTTSKVEVLYRHPSNADLAWTGRGRKPKWVEAWLTDGGTLEQLLAKKRPAHKPKGGKATSAACDIPAQRCDKTIELPLGN